jgi:hypothetical protein
MRIKILLYIAFALCLCQSAFGDFYYVSTQGNDADGDGSSAHPWKTVKYAVSKVPPNAGHTIRISEGIFVEEGQLKIPPGVNIEGAGTSLTIIKAANSFYYHPENPDYAVDKFLISLESASGENGNQSLKHFTIDGDSKQLHGGIYVRYRDNVVIEAVKVQNVNFNGIWLWDIKNSKIANTELINCSWGSTGYCAGALNLGNIESVDIDQLHIDESTGYGIKAIGPGGENTIVNLKIHNSHISVNPYGLWNGGQAPNIAIELWGVILRGCEIFDSYVDNTISLVNSNSPPATGIQSIRLHHNTIDMETRSHGTGYGVELSINDAEIDHNYFIKGSYGIANWDNPVKNWNIHHNVFYALQGLYPGDVVRSQKSGLHNVNFYNNTIEFTGNKTMNVIGLYGGASEYVNIINNLFINNSTAYSYHPNTLVYMENGSTLTNLVVKNNFFNKLPAGSTPGTYSGNMQGDPKIYKEGERPEPFYLPRPGSPLPGSGLDYSPGFPGMTNDIGAFAFNQMFFNKPPHVTISSPANDSKFYSDASLTLTASAYDSTGTIANVQFFNGTAKMGECFSAPYSFTTADLKEGNYAFKAIATDNFGATDTSTVNITVIRSVELELFAPGASLSGYMAFKDDTTASNGKYFSIPPGYGTNYTLGASAAQFNFELPQTDTYTIWVRVRAQGPENEAYYVYDGKGHWTTWMAGMHQTWTWVKIRDAYTNEVATFPFTMGLNILVFSWLHENVHVDQAVITNNPGYVPSDKRALASARRTTPGAASQFEAGDPEIRNGISLYPNPAANDFIIKYESPVAQQAEIKIIAATSVVAKKLLVTLIAGANAIKVESDNLKSGIYFVSFITSTGESFEIKTVISK